MKISYVKPPQTAVEVLFVEGNLSRYVEAGTARSVLRIGAEDRSKVNKRKLQFLVRKAIRTARENEISKLFFNAQSLRFPLLKNIKSEELGRFFAENVLMADYEYTAYKTEKKPYTGVQHIYINEADAGFKKGASKGEIIGKEINASRSLANTPGGDMTPTMLAKAAQASAKGTAVKVTILEKKDAEKLGMGLMLGVDKGSIEPMKFIILEYWGAGKTAKEKPIILVGKGITFDTGGINLKPGEGLSGMNHDMTGGATVIATITAAAKLGIKKNVVALVPAVENAVSGSAYRPGDILTSMNGKTVEVLNTDAEGRLVLADALTYAERYKPRLVIDVATLTGAAIVVAGKRASVVMTKQEQVERELRKLGEESGDYLIPLPLWDEYAADLKSNTADIANVNGTGASAKSGGGCIQGGSFLSHFTEKFSAWAHIDIASRMESIPEDNLANGSTGAPIRLLIRLLEQH